MDFYSDLKKNFYEVIDEFPIEGNLFFNEQFIDINKLKVDSKSKEVIVDVIKEKNLSLERIKKITKGLRNILKEHSYNYYERGISKISDYKYDVLIKILDDLENLIHETIPSSITRMVGIKSERKSDLNVTRKFKKKKK